MNNKTAEQIPIFLINLDRSTDRLEEFRHRLDDLNLSFERVPAVNSSEISEVDAEKLFNFRSGRLPLGKGEMGCYLSHRKVWQMIVQQKIEWAFVAEDDLHLENTSGFFSDTKWIPGDADIVKAETARQRVSLSTTLEASVDGHDIRRLLSYHGGSAGYFVSLRGAEILLQESERKCDALDHVLFHPWIGIVQKLTVYQIDPAICVQDYLLSGPQKKGFASTLSSDRKSSRASQGMTGKPSGLAKIWREISRPFVRTSRNINVAFRNASGNARIKFVPYAGDRTK